MGGDDRLYMGELTRYHVQTQSGLLKIQSLGSGDTTATTAGTSRKRFNAGDSFMFCTHDSHGNLWFIDNSDPTHYPRVHHARIGRIAVG
jgi:hypothetical protein